MANTTIQLKRSATSSNVPAALDFGELAINYTDGKLFYKHSNGTIVQFATGGGGSGDSFGTINANGTLVVADTAGDVLNLVAGNNITFGVDTVNDIITINAASGGGGGGTSITTSLIAGTTQTAVKDTRYVITNVATTTVTLPATPTLGDTLYVLVANDLATNIVARNGEKIMGLDEDLTLDIINMSIGLVYTNSTLGWRII